MSVPSSVDDLVELVRKSGMVDDARLTAYLQERKAGTPLPADSREAADAMVEDGVLTNFQAEQFLLGKWKGFTVGKYKLLERVGVGGMGQVFLCEHMFMKRRVAIKVLPPAKAEQPAALGRFYREARAAAALDHPNIVRTHDIDQDGNLHFLVMEYVDGSNLLDVVKKFGPMDIGRAVSYTRQTAAGLDYAFRSGIIHRDIKPGNVLIDRRGPGPHPGHGTRPVLQGPDGQPDRPVRRQDRARHGRLRRPGTGGQQPHGGRAGGHLRRLRGDALLSSGRPPAVPERDRVAETFVAPDEGSGTDPDTPGGGAGRLGDRPGEDDEEEPDHPVPIARGTDPGTGPVPFRPK